MVFLKPSTEEAQIVQPLVNVSENDNEIILEAEMAGLYKEDINVELKDEQLVITGKARNCEPPKGYALIHSERCPYEYVRSFALGDVIDRNKIDAQYENGILKLTLRKVEAAQPKKIEIK